MNYDEMSVAALREIAKEKDIKKVSSMKKQELIDALKALEQLQSAAAKLTEKANEKKNDKKEVNKAAGEDNSGMEAQAEGKKGKRTVKDNAAEKKPAKKNMPGEKAVQKKPLKEKMAEEKPSGDDSSADSSTKEIISKENSSKENFVEEKTLRYNASEEKPVQNRAGAERSVNARPEGRPVQSRPEEFRQSPRQQQNVQADGRMPQRPVQNGQGDGRPQQRPVQNSRPDTRQEFRQENRQPRPNQNNYGGQPSANLAQSALAPSSQQNAMTPEQVQEEEARRVQNVSMPAELEQIDSGETKEGILEVMPEGYAFVRCDNFLPGNNDVYVSPAQVRKLNLKTGDIICGSTRIKTAAEKFAALLYVKTVNGRHPSEAQRRPRFEDLTPVFPHDRIHLETPGCSTAMRIVDILSPIGKGQRGMIVSQPKAGKTTLLKQIAGAITKNFPDIHLIILLIDERPEEVTDMKESIEGKNVEVIYSTFDELPENHKRVSEMVIERAKRLVEHKQDVVILLDSITRLARAYNLTCTTSGRTLSGGLDPAALHMPKKFFGAARCMREGGSLTVLATALVDTGSRMDDVVFEEFKGTGNMELVLDRNLSEKRIFPAIDLPKSGTRRDDLLLSRSEMEVNDILRHAFNSSRADQAVEKIINMFAATKTNQEFCELVKRTKL